MLALIVLQLSLQVIALLGVDGLVCGAVLVVHHVQAARGLGDISGFLITSSALFRLLLLIHLEYIKFISQFM